MATGRMNMRRFRRTSWIQVWLTGGLAVALAGVGLGFECHCLVPVANGGPCPACPTKCLLSGVSCQEPVTETSLAGRDHEAAWMAADGCPCYHAPRSLAAEVTTRGVVDFRDLLLVLFPGVAFLATELPLLRPVLRLSAPPPLLFPQRITPTLSRRGPPSLV